MALTLAAYLEEAEVKLPPVSIRLTTSVHLTKEDICDSAKKLEVACQAVFHNTLKITTNSIWSWTSKQRGSLPLTGAMNILKDKMLFCKYLSYEVI